MVSFQKFLNFRQWGAKMENFFKPRRDRLSEGIPGWVLREMRAANGVGRPAGIGKVRADAIAANRAKRAELNTYMSLAPRRAGVLLPPFSKHRPAHAVIGAAWLRKSNQRRGKA